MVEIQCPSDCAYLATSREHPAAVTVRQQRRDLEILVHVARDFNERQSQLFHLVATFVVRYESPQFQPLVDADVAEAAAALAGTFETAARGVIYEHRAVSVPANRLALALKAALAEASKNATTTLERDLAVVLRRFEETAREIQSRDPTNPRGLLELLGRVLRPRNVESAGPPPAQPPRLIVP